MQFRFRLVINTASPDLDRISRAMQFNGPRRITRAMGKRFWEITRNNFGSAGEDRPEIWSPLSKRYIQELIRKGITTLIPTLLRRGILMNSIRIQSEGKTCEVFTENPYAMAHQFGNPSNNLPRRAYFPVTSGAYDENAQLTPFADAEVRKAANQELEQILNGK
jgi:phage gpG-like protein